MTKTMKTGISMMAALALSSAMAWALPPPPPPGDGGGIKPPDTPPPGKVYFEDNVVIVGPGFVKPDSDGGTVYIDISKLNPDPVNPDPQPGKTVERVVREVTQVKSQVEAGAVAIPPGLLDPVSLLNMIEQAEMADVFDDPAFVHEESGGREPAAVDQTAKAGSGGAAVKASPDAPAPSRLNRGKPGAPVIPSYWQLPIR
jgi:hypothetical protein